MPLDEHELAGSAVLAPGGRGGGIAQAVAAAAVLAIAFVKARFTGLWFMELRTAPHGLRLAFERWMWVVGSVLVVLVVLYVAGCRRHLTRSRGWAAGTGRGLGRQVPKPWPGTARPFDPVVFQVRSEPTGGPFTPEASAPDAPRQSACGTDKTQGARSADTFHAARIAPRRKENITSVSVEESTFRRHRRIR